MKIQISQEEKEVYKENSDFFNRKRRRCIKSIPPDLGSTVL